ncbi:MAG: hypothetical protein H7311_03495 [Ramlibacter sp.]|nr:hypothetical protein [Cryobacterium sp.]
MAFVLAAAMIVLGIAQRTVFLEPASTSLSATIADEARYAVIESSALTAFNGSQTVTVTGADTVFLAYGRSSDVKAWLGDDPYADIRQAKNASALSSKIVQAPAAEAGSAEAAAPAAETIPDPAGSDMWLEEFTAKKTLTTTVNVPAGISLIVASDGTAAAPTTVTLSWPIDNSTPWAGPLIVGGGVVGLIGLILYLLALLHLRRSHGPRRNLPRGPRMPRLPRVPRPKAIKASEITGSRRSITRSMVRVVPVVLVSGLVLSGCSADFWPSAPSAPKATATGTATPGATDLPAAEDVPPPAVTVPQLERIVSEISTLSTDADAKLDAGAIATRFSGPALAERLANYKVRAVDPALKAVPALPKAPLTLKLPQQSSSWPRVVLTVIQDKAAPTVAPLALVLRQESPRADYLVEYAMQLEPAAKVPDLASASIGAPIIAPDSKLLVLPPGDVAAAYADILMQGEASPSFGMFEAEGDTFRTQVATLRADRIGKLSKTASLEFATAVGKGSRVALATNDSGSIVAVSLTETETAKILDGGATVQTEGASKALSGVDKTAKGIQSVYGDQLLFHVPAAGSKEKIVLLGIAQGLISSSEIP